MATQAQQTTVLELPHDLTNEEKLELQKTIMKFLDTKEELEDELESAQAEFKSTKASVEKRSKDLDTEINRVRSEIKMGREMRKYRCNIYRDRDTRMVEYSVIDGPRAGEIVRNEPFTQADWDVLVDLTQSELPFPEPADEQPDLRAQADLTAPGEVQPNMENGKVIGGPETDAYNMLHKDSPYQHLSEPGGLDFKPAVAGSEPEVGTEPTDATEDAGPHLDGTPSWADDDNEATGNEPRDDEDDEPSGEDDTQPAQPKVPKRPARRK